MSTRAKVTSVDALESFRANLIVYTSKARNALEEISADVLRTRIWVQQDQRTYWQNQIRRRTKILEQAQQELFSAGIANLREVTTAEQMAVKAAKRSLVEAEEKLRVLKKWTREFDTRTEPLAKQLERLHTLLANNLPQASAYLGKQIETLHAYAETSAIIEAPVPVAASNPAKAAEPAGEPASPPETTPGGAA